jgi:hypothetical protein
MARLGREDGVMPTFDAGSGAFSRSKTIGLSRPWPVAAPLDLIHEHGLVLAADPRHLESRMLIAGAEARNRWIVVTRHAHASQHDR